MATNPTPNPKPGIVLETVRAFGRLLGYIPRVLGPILAAAWYAFIFALSSQPGSGLPTPVTGLWALNTGHSLLFGLLGLWLLLGIPRRDRWPLLTRSTVGLVLGTVLILATLDELHQGEVPSRMMSVTDVLTDLIGASCVLWICAYAAWPQASERGICSRLLLSLGACGTAGAIATFADHYLV